MFNTTSPKSKFIHPMLGAAFVERRVTIEIEIQDSFQLMRSITLNFFSPIIHLKIVYREMIIKRIQWQCIKYETIHPLHKSYLFYLIPKDCQI